MDSRKLEVIQFRLSKKEKDFLREWAAEKEMSMSDYFRYCLLQEISRRERAVGKSMYKQIFVLP